MEETFEDTNQSDSVNRRSTDNAMAKRKGSKGQITIYKTLHTKPGVNSGALEGVPVPAQHVQPVVLLLNDTNII